MFNYFRLFLFFETSFIFTKTSKGTKKPNKFVLDFLSKKNYLYEFVFRNVFSGNA